MIRLSVVIPMYNEETVISKTLLALDGALEKALGQDYEILAVNDGSTDKTEETVLRLSRSHPHIKLISYIPNRGKGGAVREGMLSAKGAFVLFTDSDLAYGCDAVLLFLREFEAGRGELILGSRNLYKDGYGEYSFLRKLMSKVYLKTLKAVAGFGYSDSQCGIKGFERTLAFTLFSELETVGFAFDLEILIHAKDLNVRCTEIPVKVIHHGSSTINPVKDALKMLCDLKKIKKRTKARRKNGQKTNEV